MENPRRVVEQLGIKNEKTILWVEGTKSSVLSHRHWQTAVEIMGRLPVRYWWRSDSDWAVSPQAWIDTSSEWIRAGPMTNLPFMSLLHLRAPLKWIFCAAGGHTSSTSLRMRRGEVGEGSNSTTPWNTVISFKNTAGSFSVRDLG